MRISTYVAGTAALFTTALASTIPHGPRDGLTAYNVTDSTCVTPKAIPELEGSKIRSIGMVLFRAFDMIDVFGTLDPFQLLSLTAQQMNLHLIAASLDPVTTQPLTMNPYNSSFFPVIQPTNTFDDDLDLDVLIVPGGPGARSPSLDKEIAYIKKVFPKIKILMTICTGAGVAAQSGVMDGYMATTNKKAWATMTAKGPDVKWVSPARFVIDGKVWSSSGVTSALDLVFNFIETYWGSEQSETIANMIEHAPLAADDDPFAAILGVEPTVDKPCEESSCE
ncbi:class I glutamine amidotransferase-like protein [Dactylonectria estremocensis]|uniref:Class I glutamine amidotransferase-like protein n=1 Tax=Dactylonectria estremocensis TaxID=1079267 RepID=A0A9P9F559_9HYPO|nr:class I glutamine amidotransferase-like protein [Dactylonectria estremocensis]